MQKASYHGQKLCFFHPVCIAIGPAAFLSNIRTIVFIEVMLLRICISISKLFMIILTLDCVQSDNVPAIHAAAMSGDADEIQRIVDANPGNETGEENKSVFFC